jgi:hypothetical protein
MIQSRRLRHPDLLRSAIRPVSAVALAAVAAACALGCTAPPRPAGEDGAPGLTPASLTYNALTANALTANALTANALTANALTANALTAGSLTSALAPEVLEDPLARQFLSYVVSCALPADAELDVTIDDVDYVFQGQLGLAPEWGAAAGSCGSDCRAWVSACVLARVDYLGVHVPLSIRGEHDALATTPEEQQAYPHREATYWGDVFASPQVRKACLSPGETEIPRVCGPSIDGCVMDVVGPCDEVCGELRDDGSFAGCSDGPGPRAEITVFLQ